MHYFAFLLRFLIIPIMILLGLAWWNKRRGLETIPRQSWPIWPAIGLHILIALIYTTPWDNYLVATGFWWFDPALVIGITISWVPIEEYTFFILQPILGGILPIEEFIFFLLTNTLITFGVMLVMAEASHQRLARLKVTQRYAEKAQRITEI